MKAIDDEVDAKKKMIKSNISRKVLNLDKRKMLKCRYDYVGNIKRVRVS